MTETTYKLSWKRVSQQTWAADNSFRTYIVQQTGNQEFIVAFVSMLGLKLNTLGVVCTLSEAKKRAQTLHITVMRTHEAALAALRPEHYSLS